MIKLSLILFLLSINTFAENFVHNGEFTTADEQKNVVALLTKKGTIFCTGSLIAPTLVITAAHCLANVRQEGLQIHVGTGFDRLDRAYLRPVFKKAQLHSVKEVFTYSKSSWDGNIPDKFFDMGIVVLNEAITDIAVIKYVKSVEEFANIDFTSPIITGYGADDEDMTGKKKTGTGKFYHYNQSRFKFNLYQDQEFKFSHHLPGDSGGPLQFKHDGQELVQVAVLHGSSMDYQIKQRIITYTALHPYLCWIENKTAVALDHEFNCADRSVQMEPGYVGRHVAL